MSEKDTLEKFMCEKLEAVSEKVEIPIAKEDPDVVEDFQINTKNHASYPEVKEVVVDYYTAKDYYEIKELHSFWFGTNNCLSFEAKKEKESLLIVITRFENLNAVRVTTSSLSA